MKIEYLKCCASRVDVVVHVDELLDEAGRRDIQAFLEGERGVSRARFHTTRQHLMIVGYDPKRTSSSAILELVRRRKVHAQLVGGL
ncbi:ATP-binding protein [Thiogranum longum]